MKLSPLGGPVMKDIPVESIATVYDNYARNYTRVRVQEGYELHAIARAMLFGCTHSKFTSSNRYWWPVKHSNRHVCVLYETDYDGLYVYINALEQMEKDLE